MKFFDISANSIDDSVKKTSFQFNVCVKFLHTICLNGGLRGLRAPVNIVGIDGRGKGLWVSYIDGQCFLQPSTISTVCKLTVITRPINSTIYRG